MANESLLDTSEAQATPKSKTLCQESLQGSDGNIDFESIVIAKTRHQVPVSVLDKLHLLERAVQQNNFRSQQRQYRCCKGGKERTLENLFSFR